MSDDQKIAEEIAAQKVEEATVIQKAVKSQAIPKFMDRFEPADFFAFILIIGVVLANLIQIKQQFMIPQALLLIVGYYFGHRLKR